MDLNTVWFLLVAVLFIGFFFLEGFDYGVGILLPFLGKDDTDRRILINTIGPVWDGNEVWMITAGGAMFAAFPHWYATMFSGFYLALLLMLLALIMRGVSFEFRSKDRRPAWRSLWDWAIFGGSLVSALLWGVAISNLIRGVAIGADMQYSGGLLPLLNPFSLLGGLVFVALFSLHGANFICLKTKGELRDRAHALGARIWLGAVLLTVAFVVWAFLSTDIVRLGAILAALVAAAALLAEGWFHKRRQEGWAFGMTGLTIASAVVMVFTGLYPRVMISSLDPAYSLTIYNASASPYTLQIMTIVAAIFVPLVLIYQGWSYWVFRQRLGREDTLEY